MIFPGLSKTIPNVPENLRESVVMAIRIIEGKTGKKIELVGAQPGTNGCTDIKYRTKKFTDTNEVDRQRKEIEEWIKNNPEKLQQGLMFLKDILEPIVKMAQKMGIKPKGLNL